MRAARASIATRLSALLVLALTAQHLLCAPLLAANPLRATFAICLSLGVLVWGVLWVRKALTPLEALPVKLRALSENVSSDADLSGITPELQPLARALVDRVTSSRMSRERATETHGHKSELLRSLRHELRTPLNAILGFSDVLLGWLEGPLTEDQRANLSVVRRSAGQLGELFDHVLELTLLAADDAARPRDEVDPAALIDQVVEAVEAKRGDRLVHVRRQLAPELYTFHGDGQRLATVLESLGRHALEHAKGAVIVLGARVESTGLVLFARDPSRVLTEGERFSLMSEPPAHARAASTGARAGTRALFSLLEQLAGLLGAKLVIETNDEHGTTYGLHVPQAKERAA
jgi:signal transduction histidine kinase